MKTYKTPDNIRKNSSEWYYENKAKAKKYAKKNTERKIKTMPGRPCPFCKKMISVQEIEIKNLNTGKTSTIRFGHHKNPYHYVNLNSEIKGE